MLHFELLVSMAFCWYSRSMSMAFQEMDLLLFSVEEYTLNKIQIQWLKFTLSNRHSWECEQTQLPRCCFLVFGILDGRQSKEKLCFQCTLANVAVLTKFCCILLICVSYLTGYELACSVAEKNFSPIYTYFIRHSGCSTNLWRTCYSIQFTWDCTTELWQHIQGKNKCVPL